jgi:AraC-like DNA-binding protein
VQHRERQLHLRLDTRRAHHPAARRLPGQVLQERGLAHPWLAAHNQSATFTRTHSRHQPVEHVAFGAATGQLRHRPRSGKSAGTCTALTILPGQRTGHRTSHARLDDPELTTATIAAAHYISPRYLQKLFEAEGSTVTDWIRRRRLDHCKRELLDPRNAGESISTIAARWGLADSSHFSRLFRATYGMSPREFRSEKITLA